MNLSYVISTYNKVEYLRISLPFLIKNLQEDEEIVVVDGGSNDGTEIYLRELYDKRLINTYVSEKDYGESHGFNKAILLAKGELIKLITDDDVFDFSVINKAKNFLLDNVEFEIAIANICQIKLSDSQNNVLFLKNYEIWFNQWEKGERASTFFCGLTMLIRKSSFTRLGLFDTSFMFVDLEFSVRVSYKKAKIKFFEEIMTIAVINEKSNSNKWIDQNVREIERLKNFYGYEHSLGVKLIPKTTKIGKLLAIARLSKPTYVDYPDFNYNLQKKYNNEYTDNFAEIFYSLSEYISEYNIEIK